MIHLFLIASSVVKLWKQFANFAGIRCEEVQLQQLCHTWWNFERLCKLQKMMKIVPVVVTWQLWKRRNALKHGNKYSLNMMVF